MKRERTHLPHAPAFAAYAIAALALAAFPAAADDAPVTWSADGAAAIGSNAYVKIADDIGGSAENWRCAAFSTAEGDFAVTSNRLWATATSGATGELPSGTPYIHQVTSAARFDGETTKSIRVQLAQPVGTTALYARMTAVTTADGDYSTIPDLREYMNNAGSSTAAAVLAANALETLVVAPAGDGTDTLSYSAADKPASLGYGAARFEYDESGAITRLTVAPTAGRTVEIKGDALAFASGGVLAHGGQGTVVISSAMTGADGLVVTNASGASPFLLYDGDDGDGWINANSFTTVYRGVDLDDIEPVEVDNRNAGGSNPQLCRVYNVMRDTVDGAKQLVAQVQVAQGGYVKYCKLLLKQDGADVVARNVAAIAAKDTSLLGQDFDHLSNVMARKPSLFGSPEWLPQNPLGKDAIASGVKWGYGAYRLKSRRIGGLPVLYVNNVITGLGGALKVAANVDVRGKTGSSFSTDKIDALNFEIDGSLTIPDRRHNFATALPGNGGRLVVAATRTAAADPYVAVLKGFATYTAQNVDANIRTLTDLVDVGGVMIGGSMKWSDKSVANPDYHQARMYHLSVTTNGWNNTVATCQLQSQNEGTLLRCVKLKFTQKDFNVQVSFETNWWASFKDGAKYGMDFEKPGSVKVTGYPKQGTLTATAVSYFSVSNLTCRFREPGQFLMSLSGANTTTDGRLVVKGTSDGGRVMASVNNVSALPASGIVDVEEGGTLLFSAGGGLGMSGPASKSQNSTAKLRVHKGGILRKWAHDSTNKDTTKRNQWAIHRAQDIFLDGGVFEPAFLWDSRASHCFTYVNNTTLRNGASIKGYVAIWAGLADASEPKTHWFVTGSSPSSCDIPVQFVGATKAASMVEFMLDVEDTTGDDTADFVFTKKVEPYSSNPYVTIGKFGGGIAEARASFKLPQGVTVYDGAFRLGASGIAAADTLKVSLEGGSLAAATGTSNALGALSVGADGGSIALGEGASLAFADSSAAAWADGAKVVVSGFAEKAIRFGTNESGITNVQRKQIVTSDGARLYVDPDGYLTAHSPAFVLVVR